MCNASCKQGKAPASVLAFHAVRAAMLLKSLDLMQIRRSADNVGMGGGLFVKLFARVQSQGPH